MENAKWKNTLVIFDVLIFCAALLVHICAACINLKHPYAETLLRADFYFCCAGIAWAVFGFSKKIIMREKVWGDRVLKAIFIVVVFPALLWLLDCVLISLYTRITLVEFVWGICSTAKYALRHIYIFLITYIVGLRWSTL